MIPLGKWEIVKPDKTKPPIQQFTERVCNPRGWGQYDSCKNSPCPYSSHSGCQHPEHPNNLKEETP
jgi:hypothetical protein